MTGRRFESRCGRKKKGKKGTKGKRGNVEIHKDEHEKFVDASWIP
jgi:hypothetical protein